MDDLLDEVQECERVSVAKEVAEAVEQAERTEQRRDFRAQRS